MNYYLSLVAQPMFVRFEFRPVRRPKRGAHVTEEIGTVQIILRFPKYPRGSVTYGPFATPIETTRAVWDARRSVRPSPAVSELNRQVNGCQASLEEAHAFLCRQQKENGQPAIIDGNGVIDAMKRLQLGMLLPTTLSEVYEQFYAFKESQLQPDRKLRKPGQISLGTLKTYPKNWVFIKQFLLYQKRGKLPVQLVTYRFATELREWMSRQKISRRKNVEKTYDTATVAKVIKLLKMLLTYAQSKEYIQANPLATFTMPAGSAADPRPLTEAQMDHLEHCELSPPLRYLCDSWLVAAELCFHYADYVQLPTMRFTTSDGGIPLVMHERSKQQGRSLVQTVNITPRAARILEKYDGPKGLYYVSDTYFSKQLKKVARAADLRDENGEIIDLQFGQGRDTGLTRRATQGSNNLQLSVVAGWKPNGRQAEKYVNDPAGIVDAFAKNLPKE